MPGEGRRESRRAVVRAAVSGASLHASAQRDALRAEIEAVLRAVAWRRATLTYQDLTSALTTARLAPNDPMLPGLLREISEGEDAAGRGLLTAVVVRRDTGRPGRGFFALAALRGRDLSDETACWQRELTRVYAACEDRDTDASSYSE